MEKNQRLNQYQLCLDEYEKNETFSDVYYKRATGELPEMECSKAVAAILSGYVKSEEGILDVGCGAGHYYRSLKNKITVPFRYTGVDPYQILLDKARKAWESETEVSFRLADIHSLPFEDDSFDYVMCNNVITHIPDIRKPLGELIRVASKRIIIRTPIYDKSYRIQLVYSNDWWPYTDVVPEDEFDENGQPRAFSYFDIHSQEFFTSVIKSHLPNANISYTKDDNFDAENLNESANKEGMIQPTRVIDGMQVSGCIILPHHFVEITKQ